MAAYVKRNKSAATDKNPFINELVSTIATKKKIQSVSAAGRSIISSSTGEISNLEAVQVTRKTVDSVEFVKVFSSGISAMFDLPSPAQDMFKAILSIYMAQPFQPLDVYLGEGDLKDHGYAKGRTARNNAINLLVAAGFIAPVKNKQHFFWTNPNMFFKGDRLTVVNQYAIEGTEDGDKMQSEIAHAKAHQNQPRLI